MIKQFCWLLCCLFSIQLTAQDKLVLAGNAPSQYVVYTVSSETSLKNISNQFGQSVTKLASFNGLALNAVLNKGARVKIPVTEYNLLRAKGDGSNAPVYHVVAKGDNLFNLSKSNKITVANLREWNQLKTDGVKLGQSLVIGFMANVKANDIKTTASQKEEPKKVPEEAVLVKTEVKPENKPVVKKEEPSKPAVSEPEKKSETKAPVTKDLPAVKAAENPASIPKETKTAAPAENKEYVPKEGDEGYFANIYSQHPKEQSQQFHSGDAATFKTISGWTDRKYYILINDVTPETIVRITAPNNKSICAKVLGPLQETKGGSGLLLRMSNSAASTLGITDPKFTVTVTYFE